MAEERGEKRKKPRSSSRRGAGNGGDLGLKREKRSQERVESVAVDTDNVENIL